MSIVKRVTHVLIVVLTLIVGATAAAVIVSQTAWFKNWLRGYIVREANTYLNGTLSIERLTIELNALATRIILDKDKRAIGVEYLKGAHLYRASAKPNPVPGEKKTA